MNYETESSTKTADDNKSERELNDTESSTKIADGNKSEGELSDTASSDPENIKKFFHDLSKDEAKIMERMLSYKIDFKKTNYMFVAERLKSDQYHAYVCIIEGEITNVKGGITYKVSNNFIEILNVRGNEGAEEKLIVDFDFQSKFAYHMAKGAYQELWSYLPNIFIGTEEKLQRIINILSSAVGKEFPQWLKPDYMYSKWLSPNRKIQK